MPALSFSCKEILQALLNHRKTQTMRPLFIENEIMGKGKVPTKIIPQPRLKVGDIVTLYWKQRSKGLRFCSKCGEATIYKGEREPGLKCLGAKEFPKLLGKVEITEVFEIEMRYVINDTRQNMDSIIIKPLVGKRHEFSLWKKNQAWASPFGHDLIKKDGFKSAEDMFKWFDKAYDLSQPKRFAVYRWRWLDE